GTNQRELVGLLPDQRQCLAEKNARDFSGAGLELAANLNGSIWLRIPSVDVAGRALQIQQDDGIGATLASALLNGRYPFSARCLLLEKVGQTQTQQAQATDRKQIAAGW